MTLQTTRLSTWFRSQIVQKQNQWLQTRQLNLFNLLGFSLREPLKVCNNFLKFQPTNTIAANHQTQKVHDKSGRAVILKTTSLEDAETEATLNVDLTITNDHSANYDPSKDVIIRNYSSSLNVSEIETMINAHKGRKDTSKNGVIGQTFAGIIESIPSKLSSDKKSFPFEIGDRVWGVSPSVFGHCWSDYVPVPYKSISHAPTNIPLHFCGLYPMQLHGLQTVLKYAKMELSDLKNKSVLFIGTGRRSMLNLFAPFLKHLDETNRITVIEDDAHGRFDEVLLKEYLGIDTVHELKYEESTEGMDVLRDEYEKSFDIVFDSIAMDKSEILENCKFVRKKGVYFWRQNHMTQFNNNVDLAKWRVALQGAQFLQQIDREIKREYGVQFVCNWDQIPSNHKDGSVLDVYTSHLSEMSFPIVIDRMYSLDDIRSAFGYAFNNDDSVLGENIGIVIEKEEDMDCETIKLPSIDHLYNNKENKKQRMKSYAHYVQSVDEIIENGNEFNWRHSNARQHGFVENKATQVVESQTIAKNTSNKS
eukprot:201874_1